VPHIKKRIVCTLLNAMSAHKDDDTMMRNGCLTLCQFKIPQDVVGSNFKENDFSNGFECRLDFLSMSSEFKKGSIRTSNTKCSF
jgi:hypothetical protein